MDKKGDVRKIMCEKTNRLTREQIESFFCTMDIKGQAIISLLMEISDDLKKIREQNEEIMRSNLMENWKKRRM